MTYVRSAEAAASVHMGGAAIGAASAIVLYEWMDELNQKSSSGSSCKIM